MSKIDIKVFEKAAVLMKSGSTAVEAAQRVKISKASLYKWISQQGRERPSRAGTADTYPERYKKLHALVLGGAGVGQAAKDMGVTLSAYYRWKAQQAGKPKGKTTHAKPKGKTTRTRRTQRDVTVQQLELAPTAAPTDRVFALVGTPAQIAQTLQQMI